MECNQIRQTFANPNPTIGIINSGFVTLVDGNIVEAGHSRRMKPAKPGDKDFKTVVTNALGNIAGDSVTYECMWKSLSKESRRFARSLGFWKKGIRKKGNGQKYVGEERRCNKIVNPPPQNPTKSIHDMTFEELAEYIKAQ